MLSPHPQPSCHAENHHRSSRQPDLGAAALAQGLLAELAEFLIARAAGAEMIQPLLNFRESQPAESYASEDCRARTPYTLGIWKFAGETPR